MAERDINSEVVFLFPVLRGKITGYYFPQPLVILTYYFNGVKIICDQRVANPREEYFFNTEESNNVIIYAEGVQDCPRGCKILVEIRINATRVLLFRKQFEHELNDCIISLGEVNLMKLQPAKNVKIGFSTNSKSRKTSHWHPMNGLGVEHEIIPIRQLSYPAVSTRPIQHLPTITVNAFIFVMIFTFFFLAILERLYIGFFRLERSRKCNDSNIAEKSSESIVSDNRSVSAFTVRSYLEESFMIGVQATSKKGRQMLATSDKFLRLLFTDNKL